MTIGKLFIKGGWVKASVTSVATALLGLGIWVGNMAVGEFRETTARVGALETQSTSIRAEMEMRFVRREGQDAVINEKLDSLRQDVGRIGHTVDEMDSFLRGH